VDDSDGQITLNSNLTREADVGAERGFPCQPSLLESSHRGDVTPDNLDPAGRAPGIAPAFMLDIDAGILDRKDQLLSGIDLE